MPGSARILLPFLVIVLLTAPVSAADYKNWIPLLPQSMDGLAAAGKPMGMNMEMGDQKWSTLSQSYKDKAQPRRVEVNIISGAAAPQAQAFQMLSKMQVETPDEIIKTLDVSGFPAVFQFSKANRSGTLMISLSQQAMVTITAEPADGEQELVSLAQSLPLRKLAELVQ